MEYIKRCKVCGHIFCYTDQDIKDQLGNAVAGIFSGLAQIGSAASGSMLNMHMAGSQAERVRNQQVDLNRCPNCRSTDLETITKEELQKIMAAEALKNGANVNINTNASVESLLKRAKIFLEDSDWPTANAYCDTVLDTEPENAEAYLGKLMAELQVTEREKLADLAEPFDSNENYKKIVRFANDELLNEILGYVEHIKNENLYKSAKEFLESAKTENDYRSIANKFKELTGYKDSEKISLECFEKAKLIKEENERKAEKARIAAEKAKIEAEKKAEADRIAAEIQKKKNKKIATIVTPVAVILVAVIVVFITVIQPMMQYNAAVALMKNGKYKEAIAAFETMGEYKDSTEKADACYLASMGEKNYNLWKNTEIGDNFTFGNYHGETEWLVLDKQGTQLLVISKNAVDCKPYNEEDVDITWENCSLRRWLNNDFINEAFDTEEQKMIVTTKISTSDDSEYGTKGGNDTEDKIFLLSIEEAEKYFTTDEQRICKEGNFAYKQSNSGSEHTYAIWYLRTPAIEQNYVDIIYKDGSIITDGLAGFCKINHLYIGVRPAMWIDLSAVE